MDKNYADKYKVTAEAYVDAKAIHAFTEEEIDKVVGGRLVDAVIEKAAVRLTMSVRKEVERVGVMDSLTMPVLAPGFVPIGDTYVLSAYILTEDDLEELKTVVKQELFYDMACEAALAKAALGRMN